jgi:hypothetical protein
MLGLALLVLDDFNDRTACLMPSHDATPFGLSPGWILGDDARFSEQVWGQMPKNVNDFGERAVKPVAERLLCLGHVSVVESL